MAKSRFSKSLSPDARPETSGPGELAAEAPKTPVRTAPLAEAQRGAWYDGPDMVTWIREYNGIVEYHLPRDVQQIMIGASSKKCHIVLPGLSAMHCALERRADRLRLIDQGSTNGTYFQDRKITDVNIAPGDTFTLAPITFLAMNDEMHAHRPTIVDVIGTGFVPSPDKLLVDAARGSANLLLTGEPNCDQDELARAIHAVSLRRSKKAIEVAEIPEERGLQRALIDSAARSTMMLSIAKGQRPLDPTFVSMVCSPHYYVRVIVLAPTIDDARAALTRDAVDQMQHVWVRPLALRSDEIERLLDRMFVARQASVRAADLTVENLAALRAYDWPDNLASLRLIADGIVAHATYQGLRPAAKALGIPKSTLQKRFDRVGMMFPLLVGDSHDEP